MNRASIHQETQIMSKKGKKISSQRKLEVNCKLKFREMSSLRLKIVRLKKLEGDHNN